MTEFEKNLRKQLEGSLREQIAEDVYAIPLGIINAAMPIIVAAHEADLATARLTGAEEAIDAVAMRMGWEETRDHLARKFGLPDKFTHDRCIECLKGENSVRISGDK